MDSPEQQFKNVDIILAELKKAKQRGMTCEALIRSTGINNMQEYLERLVVSGYIVEMPSVRNYDNDFLILPQGIAVTLLPNGFEQHLREAAEEADREEEDKRLQRKNWKTTTTTAKWSLLIAVGALIISLTPYFIELIKWIQSKF